MNEEEKRLLEEAKKVISDNRGFPNGMIIINETMNNIYRYFKKVISEATFEDKRLLEIFKLELLLKNDFLPLDSAPIFDQNNPPVLPSSIVSEEDCERMLDCIVFQARSKLNEIHDLRLSPLTKMNIVSAGNVEDICRSFGVQQRRISCSENLDYGNYNSFNIISFDLDGETKMYLVDCTYRQFFTYADSFIERIGMPFNSGANLGSYMIKDATRKKMAEELLTKGYVEFNSQNVKNYFDGFVFAGRNGFYYESLNKPTLTSEDYVPNYTFADYLYALNNRGVKEPFIGKQFGVLKRAIIFEDGGDKLKTDGLKHS